MLNVLSVQSHVAYGHVGNSSAVFALQRLGVEVWPVHTVQFSNHTGYGAWRGRVFDGPAVDEVVEGIAERGVLGSCDAVLSGYLGSADIGHAVVGAVARVRAANPAALYCCDPVIGDVGRGVFVRPGILELLRDVAVPAADVVTPNHFELDALAGTTSRSLPAVKDAVAAVQALGPRVVLTTSLVVDDTPPDAVDLLASADGEHVRVRTPRLGLSVNGAGDAVAALFLAHWLATRSVPEALGRAAASVFGLLQRTEDAGSREIVLIAAQDELVSPSRTFPVDRSRPPGVSLAAVSQPARNPDETVADLERQLTVLLRRARAWSSELARSVHPDLEASAYGLLMHVVDGGARATDLAEYFGIDKSTVSRQVRLLEQLGLLAREPDPDDLRVLRLVATPEGHRRLAAAREARRRRVEQRLAGWEPGDVAALADLLGRYNDAAG